MIATVNKKFLIELEAEREKWPDVNYAPIIKNNAKQMKGCYTRYVNNYDAAEAKLRKIRESHEAGSGRRESLFDRIGRNISSPSGPMGLF